MKKLPMLAATALPPRCSHCSPLATSRARRRHPLRPRRSGSAMPAGG
jgi:hypothetical protein